MVNIAKKASEENGYDFLRGAFKDEQTLLEQELGRAKRNVTHDGVMGSVGEQCWIEMLRKYLPRRYAVDTAIIIDSEGHTSDQIDIVIYDPQYTPTLFGQKSHFYVPAEAVYAIFEAKPKINKALLEYAADKAASVRRLKRTSAPIPHSDGLRPAKKPFPITAGIVALEVEWSQGFGQTFQELIKNGAFESDRFIDCGCGLSHGSFDMYDPENILMIGPKEYGLAFFLFRLLGKLQSLGTVPAIDWNAYAQVISEGK